MTAAIIALAVILMSVVLFNCYLQYMMAGLREQLRSQDRQLDQNDNHLVDCHKLRNSLETKLAKETEASKQRINDLQSLIKQNNYLLLEREDLIDEQKKTIDEQSKTITENQNIFSKIITLVQDHSYERS